MVRIILGVIAGFFAWFILWLGSEKVLSAIWPAFSVHQRAFQAAIENGSDFTADTGALLTHIVLASIASVIAGFLAALAAGENSRAPLIVGILLLVMGLAKAYMSWPYVPLWYHVILPAILLPIAIMGGKLYSSN